jgi:hypothetical protein
MKKVYIIGDCNTTRLEQNAYTTKAGSHLNLDIAFWSKSGQSINRFDPINFFKINLESEKIVYNKNDQMSSGPKKWRDIKDDGVAVFWLGYIDAKNHLHKYKNSEDLALEYIKSIKENFPLSEIILIEPHPQFVDNIFMSTEKLPVVEYKERKEQNDLLCEALNKYAKDFGITKVITQKEMLDAMGLKEITLKETADYHPIPTDGLDMKYINDIYNLILSYIAVD